MATVRRETLIEAPAARIWDAVRDVGNIHRRLVPGFVLECRLEGGSRLVTFGNGMSVREHILDVDDEHMRHAWNAIHDQFQHYSASLQVFPDGENRSRVLWLADLLPAEMAGPVAEMMDQGLEVMKRTLEMPLTD